MSMNSLRAGDSTPREGESLLRPTPGSASSRYLNSGSMRKLTIDKSLRTEIFAEPKQIGQARESDGHALRKQVSFDGPADGSKQSNAEPGPSNALVRTEESEGEESPQSLFRAAPTAKPQTNGVPEMQQVNGNSSLTTVFENGDQRPTSAPSTNVAAEKIPSRAVKVGEYSTTPSIKDLKNMSRTQLSKLNGLTVSRDGVGRIEFGPCDLTSTNLDDICGTDDGKGIVHLKLRSATVYPDEATKPARGKGLNVPSTIYLLNSWPKSHGGRKAVLTKSGPAYDKHLRRLKQTTGTKFLNYDADTGTWSFTVEHFTTYGLDDDDEDETDFIQDVDMYQDTSGLSDPPETPAHAEDDTLQSIETATGVGEVDDTFEFKINKRSTASATSAPGVPGGFDESHTSYDYDDPSADDGIEQDHMMSGGLGDEQDDPFMSASGGAVQAPSRVEYDRYHSSMALDEDNGAIAITEEQQDSSEPELPGSFAVEEPRLLRSILKPTSGLAVFNSPQKLATETWEEQLQRTISPKKRDRQYLRELQQSARVQAPMDDVIESPFKRSMLGQSVLGQSYLAQKSAKKVGFGGSVISAEPTDFGKSQAFRTSMDIMNSLWSQEKTGKKAPAIRGFEV
jgi:nuclear pore complex protein Nup98-Nup96